MPSPVPGPLPISGVLLSFSFLLLLLLKPPAYLMRRFDRVRRQIDRRDSRARAKTLPTQIPAIAPLLKPGPEDGGGGGGGDGGGAGVLVEEDDDDVVGVLVELAALVFLGVLAVDVDDGTGRAVDPPVVMKLRYESVTICAVGPQYMMYWFSRTLVIVTQEGAADGLGWRRQRVA